MAPRKEKKPVKKVYDYSGLEKGMRVQAAVEGVFYAAEIVVVSESKNRVKAPVKVHFQGYDASEDLWVNGDSLRSKALKTVQPEKENRPPLEITMGYWGIRGLGAPLRMILEYKGVKYTDNQYTDPDKWFKEDKPKILEENPLANLPYIQCGKDTVTQSNSCFTYLGRRLRMGGGGNKAQMMNDQLLNEVMDVRNAMIELVYPFKTVCRDEAEHKEKAKKKIESKPFAKFEEVLTKGDTDYFCGKSPCTSDFHIWEMLDQYKLLAEKNGITNMFDDIPKCKAFYDRFRALPALQKYFESDAYKLPINNQGANAYFA